MVLVLLKTKLRQLSIPNIFDVFFKQFLMVLVLYLCQRSSCLLMLELEKQLCCFCAC